MSTIVRKVSMVLRILSSNHKHLLVEESGKIREKMTGTEPIPNFNRKFGEREGKEAVFSIELFKGFQSRNLHTDMKKDHWDVWPAAGLAVGRPGA